MGGCDVYYRQAIVVGELARSLGVDVSSDRRCQHCRAPIGARDRVCFSCRRAVDPVPPGAALPPSMRHFLPAQAPRAQAPYGQALPPGRSVPAPRLAPGEARLPRAAGPVPPIQIELVWGRAHRVITVPAAGATIGSVDQADVVVPATFLAPLHARIAPCDGAWTVESLAPAGQVLLHGSVVRRATVTHGDVFRLADRLGNFVTVKMPAGRPGRAGPLGAALPGPDESYLIGSAPRCRVRLDHPLVQPQHVAVRRDSSWALWLADRGTAAGTYLNGRRLRGQQRAGTGDILQVGPYRARVGPSALEPLEQVPGVDVRVHDARADAPRAGSGRARTLLDHVSLRLAPASLTVLAGASGAGQTALMRLLSGQLAAADGSVSYNGADLAGCRQAYATLMGYVPQEDVVHADLTVHEALGYQARLRLGRGPAQAARDDRIEHVLTLLGLADQQDQLVKTLSGGQRKRVSIACELLNEPQILFLDEPTSGLDPGLDKRMMLLLRLLADQGRTVVLTAHAIAHVDVCDTLVLVGPGGHVIYAGAPEAAPAWFGVPTLGDVFSVVESPDAVRQAARRVLLAQQADGSGPGPAPAGRPPPGTAAGVSPSGRPGAVGGARPPVGSSAWQRAVADQAQVFTGRYVRLVGRDRAALGFNLLQVVAVAVATALVVPKPLSWATAGSAPVFVFGCAAVWFGMIGAVRELAREKPAWHREFLAGGAMPAYLTSKVTVLGALAGVQALTLTVVAGWTVGLPGRNGPLGDPFITFFITLWLGILSGMALGLLVSAASASADRAMSLLPYLLITQVVLCGAGFRLGAAGFVSWIMPARWSVSGLGGIAGLYPPSAAGLAASWLMLLVLCACGLAATAWLLQRQGRRWSAGW